MKTNQMFGAIVLLIAIVAGGLLYLNYGLVTKTVTPIPGNTGGSNSVNLGSCPADGTTSVIINAKNVDNKATSEGVDVTGYLYKLVNGQKQFVTEISDTTNPSAITVDCGATYEFDPVGVVGTPGVNSVVKSVLSGDATVQNGELRFSTDSATDNLVIGVEEHSTLKCRAWDNNQGSFAPDSANDTPASYKLTGVKFMGADSTSLIDASLGLDYDFQCVGTNDNGNFNDRGVLVLVKAPTNTWTEPVVYANGVKLQEATSELTDYEKRAFNNYDYVFIIPESVAIKSGANGIDLRFKDTLLSGVTSASADPEIKLVPRTQYLSTRDGISVLMGAVEDNSATTEIFPGYDLTLGVAN